MLIEESCIEFCLGKLSLIQQDAATKQSGGIEILTLAYDFFEAASELSLDSLRSISVRICPVNGCLRINLLIDCDQSLDSLREEYPQAVILSEDDGIILVLPLEGGNGS